MQLFINVSIKIVACFSFGEIKFYQALENMHGVYGALCVMHALYNLYKNVCVFIFYYYCDSMLSGIN